MTKSKYFTAQQISQATGYGTGYIRAIACRLKIKGVRRNGYDQDATKRLISILSKRIYEQGTMDDLREIVKEVIK